MALTDRQMLKQQHKGQFNTAFGASTPLTEIEEFHKRQRDVLKTGAEAAGVAVAETTAFIVKRRSILRLANIVSLSTVTGDPTNFAVITVTKRDSAGANLKTLATWSTSTAAQSTLTAFVPAAMSLTATAADLVIAAGSIVTYAITKSGTGVAIPANTIFSLDLEED